MKRKMMFGLLLSLGIVLLSHGAWIQVKAVVAQALLQTAWAATVVTGMPKRPWPWADHWPVAEIVFKDQEEEGFIVLHGDSGSVLAFAPGWNPNSARPGSDGTAVISAHRDTHFTLLKESKMGDRISLVTDRGIHHQYRIEDIGVVDSDESKIVLKEEGYLVLVTCYPFDATTPGGSLRYVVEARKV